VSADAFTIVCDTHGCKSEELKTSHMVAVCVCGVSADANRWMYLPAVVDDFGDLVIVGGPL
jgi:hypothetical protein